MSDTNSEIIWYIARDGQQHGPLSDAEMRLFVQSGHLKPSDLVWNPQMTDWQSAADVFAQELAPAPVVSAPAPEPDAAPANAPPHRAQDDRRSAAAPSGSQPESAGPAAASPAETARMEPAATSMTAHMGSYPGTARYDEPGRTPAAEPVSSASAGSPSAGPGYGYPAPDEVLPSFRSQRARPADTAPANVDTMSTALDAKQDYDDDDGPEPRRRSRLGLMAGSFLLAAAVAGGGVVAFQNKDSILGYMNERPDADPPVVKADSAPVREPARPSPQPPSQTAATDTAPAPAPAAIEGPSMQGITVTVPPTAPAQPTADETEASDSVPLETIDSNLQKSQLWRVVKSEFPEWYTDRVKEIARLSGTASETDLSKHLIGKLVQLRREHSRHALSSSTDHLKSIATAFLTNLKSLAGHSTEACYTFISRGETSPDVISLFPKPGYGDAIEGQIAAVFRAVADGRKSPVQRQKATKPDYDMLAAELTKIGWSKADLGLFANPQALAKAPPERVCKMVQDWFSAHVAISDKDVQERLLVETLRPVVAG